MAILKKASSVVSDDFPSVRKFLATPEPADPSRRLASSRAHFLHGDFSQRPLPPFTTSDDPMPDPPPLSYGRFFLFYPARRRSDRWAINELKRPSFFLVSLWLSSSDALPPASPSPLHHPSYPSLSPHSTGEHSLFLSL